MTPTPVDHETLAEQLLDWSQGLLTATAGDLRGIAAGMKEVAQDLQTRTITGTDCHAIPRVAVGDLAAAIRGCCEAGYFDDDVKHHLGQLAEDLHGPNGPRRAALVLVPTDEACQSAGDVQDLIRKAAGLPEDEDPN